MTINTYMLGTQVRVRSVFTDAAGAAYDPGTVTIFVRKPRSATSTAYVYGVDEEVIRASTGNFYIDVIPDIAGKWRYRGAGTVTGPAADENEFEVRASRHN